MILTSAQEMKDYARALSVSLAADMRRAQPLARAVARKEISAQGFTDIIIRDLMKEVKQRPGVPLFPNLRALMRTQLNLEAMQPAGMNTFDWSGVISSVLPAVTAAAGTYYTAKYQAQVAESQQKLELQKAALALKAADLQASVARATQADAAGQPTAAAGMPGGTVSAAQAAEASRNPIAKWLLPAGVGLVLGGVVYYATR